MNAQHRRRSTPPRCIKRRDALRAPAFTLVELVVGIVSAAILMTGIASAIMIASRALPAPNKPAEALMNAYQAVEQFVSDAACAVSVSSRTATGVEFLVPDRDGDGSDDAIRWSWSGTSGQPLIRSYNAKAPVTILEQTHQFQLNYVIRSETEQPPPTENESAVVLLSSHETGLVNLGYSITDARWVGQYFTPSLPGGVTSWKVTQVSIRAQSNGATNGVTAVQLRTASSGLPTQSVLGQALMYENLLTPSYAWRDFPISGVSNLQPGIGLCLTLVLNTSDTYLADVQYGTLGGGGGRFYTSTAGSSWSKDGLSSMYHRIYGTYTTTSQPPDVQRDYLLAIDLTVQPLVPTASRVDTQIQLHNTPELTGA